MIPVCFVILEYDRVLRAERARVLRLHPDRMVASASNPDPRQTIMNMYNVVAGPMPQHEAEKLLGELA